MYLAYLITNLVNGKVYVGKTGKSLISRWNHHLANARGGRHSKLYSAMRKYGFENFSIQVLSVASTPDHLDCLERHLIKQFKSNDPLSGYNMTEGGDGLSHPSEETRKKISLRLMGNQNGIGNKSPGRKGQHLSEEHRRKIGMSNRGVSRGFGNQNARRHKGKI